MKKVIDICKKINTFLKKHEVLVNENPILISLIEYGMKRELISNEQFSLPNINLL